MLIRTPRAALLLLTGAVIAGAPFAASAQSPVTPVPVDSGRFGYTKADVDFMTGMIAHHSQALVMAGWAKSHGANPSVVTLASRITVGQSSEIELIKRWLAARHEPVPDSSHAMAGMAMPGMAMGDSLMPGMLTPEQMKQLDAARGKEFDRLFLTDMIQHHTGAIAMVNILFDTYGAGQDDVVFKFATGVNADQMTEIDRMTQMLSSLSRDH